MVNVAEIIGKRLVSDKRITMYYRFPGSDDIKVVPPGQPTPVIDSYLPSGYYQLNAPNDVNKFYVQDTENVRVVSRSTPDQSSLFDRVEAAFVGPFTNVEKDIQAGTGNLSQGFDTAVRELRIDAFSLGKYVKEILLIVVVILFLYVVSKIL